MVPKSAATESFEAQTQLRSLRALDVGAYAEAIARYEECGGAVGTDAESLLWRAEVATYLYRLEDALEVLEAAAPLDVYVADAGPSGHLARRRALLVAEIAPLRGEPEAAKVGLEAVLEHARVAGDALIEMRARLNLARLARFQSEWSVALARAAEAARLASSLGNQYFRGCALWNRGVALYELGTTEEAEAALREAVGLLTATENLRFRAATQNALAGLLTATGRLDEVWDLYASAEATFLSIGSINDLQVVRHSSTWALFAAGRYQEARERVFSLLDIDRVGGDTRAELFGLKLLACMACIEDRAADALRIAEEHSRLAAMAGSDVDRLEARLLVARARGKALVGEAVEELQTVLCDLEDPDLRSYRALAALYLAEALLERDPIAAGRRFADARAGARLERFVWVRAELTALERNWARQPIKFEEGKLVIDLSGSLPLREVAHDAIDRALLSEALERTGGSYAKAGRLIGEQRWNTRHLARRLGVAPPAPRSEGGRAISDEAILEELTEQHQEAPE